MAQRPIRVLMVTSELESFARTGGLGDMVEGLSRSLAELGADVIAVTPLYGVTTVPAGARWWPYAVHAPVGWGVEDIRTLGVQEITLVERLSHGGRLRVMLLADDRLFRRNGLYGDENGPFGDNELRFAALSRGALAVADAAWPELGPDILHAHDWHAALSILYARLTMGPDWAARRSIFTIHNLAFQGVLGFESLDPLGIPRDAYERGSVAHQGKVNLMKGAIELADRVTTVSPTYAQEILRPENGHGLDPHLVYHRDKVLGIVNGIDTRSFDPEHDPAIAHRYDVEGARNGKRACKAALLGELGLHFDLDAPLFGLVSRLTWQKGIDLIPPAVPALVERGARFAFIGQGDLPLQDALVDLARKYPGRVATKIAFDGNLAKRVFAGSDFLLIPSRYEPCGLTQMYAMRYGAIPIVTAVGGLKDTVAPFNPAHDSGTGIVVRLDEPHPMLVAGEEALAAYADREGMGRLITRAMRKDHSWGTSATAYRALYESLLGLKG